MTNENTLEKVGLLALGGISIIALSTVALLSLRTGTLDPNAATLLGAIVAALGAFAKDIIQAIRGYSMSAQLGKVTDQLAAAGPVTTPDTPQSVVVTNTLSEPVPVSDTANSAANEGEKQ